nr:hypothetical protein [Pseudomonas sp. BIGb0427]
MLTLALLLGAGAGFVLLMGNIRQMHGRASARFGVALLYLLSPVALVWSVPGMMLFLAEPNLEARNFIGFSPVLVLLLLFSHELLGRVWPGLRWLLILPTLFMFAFSYAYGQVIIAKKELESAMAHYIANDLVSRSELRDVNRYTYLRAPGDGNWLPRGHGAITHAATEIHPQRLQFGVACAVFFPGWGSIMSLAVNARTLSGWWRQGAWGAPLVDNRFYSIYVTGEQGFIVMKPILKDEKLQSQLAPRP